jgi:PAS domain S-box-containing protein
VTDGFVHLQKALAEAHAAREQVDNILRSAGDGMVVTDRRNRVTHINQVAMEMLGVTAEEVVGKSYVRLFKNPELRRQAASFFAIRDISARQHDFLLRRDAAAEPDVMQARITPLRDRDGTLAGLVTLLRDVTRERKLDQLKSEFISTAAHEMRTPMSVITGYAELLLDLELVDSFDAEQKREFLREICRKVETLSRLVDDLFDISRIEAGLPLSLERAPCELNAVINEVVQRFASRSPRHDFAVTLADVGPVVVDGSKMAQVFDNLISNAVKYSPQGGRIEICSAEADGLLRFTVRDQGIGMTPAQLARVFEKFYRADSSNTAVGGLGLGMSIVKAIVEAHGGTIRLESQPKAGTTVIFAIPMA